MRKPHAINPARNTKTVKALMFEVTEAQASFLFSLSNTLLAVGGLLVFVGTIGSIAMGAKKEFFANVRQSENEAEIARALESAAIANERAEAERLERARLEQQIAPRRLTIEQQVALIEALAPMGTTRVFVASYTSDVEAGVLAEQLTRALTAAGLIVTNKVGRFFPVGPFLSGIHVMSDNAGLREALRQALSQSGGLAVAQEVATIPGWAAPESAPDGSAKVDASILVGAKPPATAP